MNKIKIDNYYEPESKTLRLDEIDYTIIPNSDIKPLLDKLQQENEQLNALIKEYQKTLDEIMPEKMDIENNWNKLKEYLHNQIPTDKTVLTKHIKIFEVLDKMQELEKGSENCG